MSGTLVSTRQLLDRQPLNIGLGPSVVWGSDQGQKEGMTPGIQLVLNCCPSTAAEAPVGMRASYGYQEPWDLSGPHDALAE